MLIDSFHLSPSLISLDVDALVDNTDQDLRSWLRDRPVVEPRDVSDVLFEIGAVSLLEASGHPPGSDAAIKSWWHKAPEEERSLVKDELLGAIFDSMFSWQDTIGDVRVYPVCDAYILVHLEQRAELEILFHLAATLGISPGGSLDHVDGIALRALKAARRYPMTLVEESWILQRIPERSWWNTWELFRAP